MVSLKEKSNQLEVWDKEILSLPIYLSFVRKYFPIFVSVEKRKVLYRELE